MRRVRPGVLETMARSFLRVRALINDDLPTLERPINANSGNSESGQLARSGELIRKSAD